MQLTSNHMNSKAAITLNTLVCRLSAFSKAHSLKLTLQAEGKEKGPLTVVMLICP